MKILIEEKKTKQVEIETPSFFLFSDDWGVKEMCAVFSEEDVRVVIRGTSFSAIHNTKFSSLENSNRAKLTDENIITEDEFMGFYNSVHESLNLMPVLK